MGLGELSAARQALESSVLAPGNLITLNALKDPDRRPELPRDDLPDALRNFRPPEVLDLDQDKFVGNLRSARKGAAAGPSFS